MLFKESERAIYEPPEGSGLGPIDPLALLRRLRHATGGRLAELWSLWRAPHEEGGDVSPEGRTKAAVGAAEAEEMLVQATRRSLGLKDFPECTDAQTLEILWHFFEWCEGKDSGAATPRS